MTPEQLRKEAAEAEFMARVVSYQADKQWLTAKAVELRRLAERLEARNRDPRASDDDPGVDARQ